MYTDSSDIDMDIEIKSKKSLCRPKKRRGGCRSFFKFGESAYTQTLNGFF